MDSFFEGLYERFILRDIVGKAVPGLIALITIYVSLFTSRWHIKIWDFDLVFFSILYSLSFVAGLSLEYFGTRLGWIKTYVWKKARGASDVENSLTKYKSLHAKTKTQRERFVFLKQVSGNFGMAAVAVLVTKFIDLCYSQDLVTSATIAWALVLVLMAVFLFKQSYDHAKEQLYWEGGKDKDFNG